MVLEYHEWRPGRAPNSDLCTRETDRGTMIPPMRSSAFSGVSPEIENDPHQVTWLPLNAL